MSRCPSTIDGSWATVTDSLGPVGHHIAHSLELKQMLTVFSQV